MAKEQNLTGSPRRKSLLVGVTAVLLVAVGSGIVWWRNDGSPRGPRLPGGEASGESDAGLETPAFRFTTTERVLVPTSPAPVEKRQRRAGRKAAATAATLLTDLYTEGFLDPAERQEGRYDDALRIFAAGALQQAKARITILTAGPDADSRYHEVLPVSGRLSTRILLDRSGTPTLMVSLVSFKAKTVGPETAMLRSEGQFFFERVDGQWKVVSFLVTRSDRPEETA